MAIDDRSLETRLGEIVPQQLSLPDPLLANVDTSMPVDTEFAADESMEPVEVAGLGLIKGLLI